MHKRRMLELKEENSNIGSLYTDMVSLPLSDCLIEKIYGILNFTVRTKIERGWTGEQ